MGAWGLAWDSHENPPSPRAQPGTQLQGCLASSGRLGERPEKPKPRRVELSAGRPSPQASLWSAGERSRGLRREDREGLPDGARQRARWRSIAGRSRSPEAPSGQGEGVCLSPCSANGAAADLWLLRDLSPPRSGSRQRCPSRCASRARRGGTDLVVVPPKPSEQGAARGAALGAMDTWGGRVQLHHFIPAPAAGGQIWSGGRRRMLAFGDERRDKSCSRRQSRAPGAASMYRLRELRRQKTALTPPILIDLTVPVPLSLSEPVRRLTFGAGSPATRRTARRCRRRPR
jgi:hypothetical protein